MKEHYAYGHRRVATELCMNHKKVGRIMNLYNLRPKVSRKHKPNKKDDLENPDSTVKNILNTICPTAPNTVWVGDFTYFWFHGRFWYLATVIDIHTREILGWHFASHHTASLVTRAFEDAIKRTGTTPKYFHSDQGSEYLSESYEKLLMRHNTIASHSRKSSP
jgi:putative transposase